MFTTVDAVITVVDISDVVPVIEGVVVTVTATVTAALIILYALLLSLVHLSLLLLL
jgi:hypothetical protein